MNALGQYRLKSNIEDPNSSVVYSSIQEEPKVDIKVDIKVEQMVENNVNHNVDSKVDSKEDHKLDSAFDPDVVDTGSVDSRGSVDIPELTSNSGTSFDSSMSSFSPNRRLNSSPLRSDPSSGGSGGNGSGIGNADSKGNHIGNNNIGNNNHTEPTPLDKATKNLHKKLKSSLHKFKNHNGTHKTNCLRLSLLPFIRNHQPSSCTCADDRSYLQTILYDWWLALLKELDSGSKSISGFDMNAFYEGVSSIMSYPIWDGSRMQLSYQTSLNQTLQHVFKKNSNLKQISTPMAAFTGKVIAYGYIYIPGFASYILRVLNPSTVFIKRFMKLARSITGHVNAREMFPEHLSDLVGVCSVTSSSSSSTLTSSLMWLNQSPNNNSSGMSNPWINLMKQDSILFAAFLKHICSLQCQLIYQSELISERLYQPMLINAPGLIIIFAAVAQHINSALLGILKMLKNQKCNFQNNVSMVLMGQQFNSRVDHLRIFTAIREILHSDIETSQMCRTFANLFDISMQCVTVGTNVFDMTACTTVCDIAEEWIYSVFSVTTTKIFKDIHLCGSRLINWDFWLEVPRRMLSSGNIYTEIRALSFLFNIWPFFPKPTEFAIAGDDLILKKSTDWILSDEIWSQLFFHWSPLVRSYYHRLLCYRVTSISNTIDPFSFMEALKFIELESKTRLWLLLNRTYNSVTEMRKKTAYQPEVSPSLPAPNMRIGINIPKHSGGASELPAKPSIKQLYPFDVIDNAAYLASESLSTAFLSDKGKNKDNKIHSKNMSTTSIFTSNTTTTTLSSATQSTISTSKKKRNSGINFNSSKSNTPRSSTVDSMKSILSSSSDSKPNSNRFSFFRKLIPRKTKISNMKADANTCITPTSPASRDPNTANSNTNNELIVRPKRLKRNGTVHTMHTVDTARSSNGDCASGEEIFSTPKSRQSDQFNDTHRCQKPLNDGLVKSPLSESAESTSSTTSSVITSSSEPCGPHTPSASKLNEIPVEVKRPVHQFILVPTRLKPRIEEDIVVPILPFDFKADLPAVDLLLKAGDHLPIWNYGSKSLAEWNLGVFCYENYIRQTSKVLGHCFSTEMPRMKVEIPWKLFCS